MKIFVNDKSVELIGYEELDPARSYDFIFSNLDELPSDINWEDDILFHEPSHDTIIRLLYLLRTRKMKELDSITLVTKDKKAMKDFIKSRFMIIKAAGGIVAKENKVLMIFRFGKWDFPKGKFDKGESPGDCAKREVEEETNVRVKLGPHICNTWHTYTQNRKSILKKTYWFAMDSVNDAAMKPQVDEGIEEILWLSEPDAKTALINSYPSMRYLFKQYIKNHIKI